MQQFSAKWLAIINEPVFEVAAHRSTGLGENRRSVLLLFCIMESITERRESCSQVNGAQESVRESVPSGAARILELRQSVFLRCS